MKDVFLEANRILEENKSAVLARIIRHKGSAPRGTGTRCLILEDGSIVGTIGGGRMEYLVLQKARKVLREKTSEILKLALYGKDVAETEMLCGGAVDIYLEPLFAGNPETRHVFSQLARMHREGSRGVLVTRIVEGGSGMTTGCRALFQEDATVAGRIEGLDSDALQETMSPDAPRLLETEKSSLFIEPVQPPEVLFLFGAGHISLFVSPMADLAGFRVVLMDDRKEFANPERFPEAAEIRVAPFSDTVKGITVTPDSYIAIITRGHIHDQTVLREVIHTRAKYIGMIGSRRKRDTIYAALEKEGVSKETLARVHCPIGIRINAHTPEEIAVSIVAELISVRNTGKKKAVTVGGPPV